MKINSRILIVLIFLSCVFSNTFSQTDSTYLNTEEIIEDILQEPTGEIDESDLYDIIEQLMLNPINLNTASSLCTRIKVEWYLFYQNRN